MKHSLLAGLVLLCATLAFSVDKKIAIVDMQQLIKTSLQTDQIKAMSKKIQSEKVALTKELEGRQNQLREIQMTYVKLKKDYDNRLLYMTEEEKKKKIAELTKQKNAYEYATNKIKEFDKKAKSTISSMNAKIKSTMMTNIKSRVKALAEKEKYDFVFYSEALAFHNEATEITDAIDKQIKEEGITVSDKPDEKEPDVDIPLKQ